MIVACGGQSNGTRLLTRIIATSGEDVIHRSLPHGGQWWKWTDFPPGTRFVVIIRDIRMAIASEVRINPHLDNIARLSEINQKKSLRWLRRIPNAYFVSYEELVASPDEVVSRMSRDLGLNLSVPEEIYDANEKYRRPDVLM